MKSLRHRIGRLSLVVRDRRTRSEWFTAFRFRRQVHQDTTYTELDRYPRLFAQVQAHFGREFTGTILSFGCSSGEEVVSLRRYFPQARICGTDINRARLADCRRLKLGDRVEFYPSHPARIASAGPYDAIFCMAVLQRRPHQIERDRVWNIARYYPFATFDDQVMALVEQLKPGGLLVVEHTQYLVEQSRAFQLLEPHPDDLPCKARGMRFGRDGERLAPHLLINRVYRRRVVGAA